MKMYVVSPENHNRLVHAAYRKRGFTAGEADDAARACELTARHGIRTHNALKALDLDDHLGSRVGGCVPGAGIEKLACRFEASEVWDANKKLGPSVAFAAMERCTEMADRFGIGQISVDNAFHYLWGGGYVLEAARKGYIAYTNCTAALAEVVPFQGKSATLGTNPHSWGFPTTEAVGYPIVIDWATSIMAMGKVQQLKREGGSLPPDVAVDKEGRMTIDPNEVAALRPFGGHKGYGLALINELGSALIGGSLPTLRCRENTPAGEKSTPTFYFQVIHPDAIGSGNYALGRDRQENLAAVIRNILGPGNEACRLPGQIEAEGAWKTEAAGGLLFTEAEIQAFNTLANNCGETPWDISVLPTFDENASS